MPHFTVEVPAALASRIDWRRCFELHQALYAIGYGRVEDFKSQVLVIDHLQVADAEPFPSLVSGHCRR